VLLSLLLLACESTGAGSAPAGTDSGSPGTDSASPGTEEAPERVDVVVIGAGAAGLAAAVAARDAGAEVIVLEREDHWGGSGLNAGIHWAAGTTWQEDAGIEDSPELALEEWSDFTGGEEGHPWVESFVFASAENLEWLVSQGADFSSDVQFWEDMGTPSRRHQPQQVSPIQALGSLAEADVWLQTQATGVRDNSDGTFAVDIAFLGEVPDAAGDTPGGDGWIRAAAVVVATGGYGRASSLIDEVRPDLLAFPRHYETVPENDGNGLDLVEQAGAALTGLDNLIIFSHGVEDATLGAPETMFVWDLTDSIIVDAAGARVFDESRAHSGELGQIHAAQGPLWAILDVDALEALDISGFGFNYDDTSNMVTDGVSYAQDMDVPSGTGLAELAAELGIDGDTLVSTVDAYNDTVLAVGTDPMGKDLTELSPLDTPPFHALPLVIGIAKSLGGPTLGPGAEALDAQGVAVPGLYAAGELAGFLGGADLGWGFNGSVAACYYAGRIAGESAAAWAEQVP
jgi:succinate dehydrogenase/fumarate reductase flavoprotein subunit